MAAPWAAAPVATVLTSSQNHSSAPSTCCSHRSCSMMANCSTGRRGGAATRGCRPRWRRVWRVCWCWTSGMQIQLQHGSAWCGTECCVLHAGATEPCTINAVESTSVLSFLQFQPHLQLQLLACAWNVGTVSTKVRFRVGQQHARWRIHSDRHHRCWPAHASRALATRAHPQLAQRSARHFWWLHRRRSCEASGHSDVCAVCGEEVVLLRRAADAGAPWLALVLQFACTACT